MAVRLRLATQPIVMVRGCLSHRWPPARCRPGGIGSGPRRLRSRHPCNLVALFWQRPRTTTWLLLMGCQHGDAGLDWFCKRSEGAPISLEGDAKGRNLRRRLSAAASDHLDTSALLLCGEMVRP